MSARSVVRGAVATAVVVASVGGWVGPAAAHVTIDTLGEVEQGSFAKLGLSVPNERADAGTVRLEVQLPQDHPLTFVSVQPKAGWEVETTMRRLDPPIEVFGTTVDEVVDTISWTADEGTQIAPGQFDLFWISAGAMPTDVDRLTFPAIQTYSSGEEVAWIERAAEGGDEPEHPAPAVDLVAPASPGATPASEADDDGRGALAVVALVVGALGLVAGALGIGMARRALRRAATR